MEQSPGWIVYGLFILHHVVTAKFGGVPPDMSQIAPAGVTTR